MSGFFPELTWQPYQHLSFKWNYLYHFQKDANVNNPTNTFLCIDVRRFSDVLFIYLTIEKQLFQITT